MTSFKISSRWLSKCLGTKTDKQNMLPVLTVSDNILKLALLENEGCSMRVHRHHNVTATSCVKSTIIRIPNCVRDFVNKLGKSELIEFYIKQTDVIMTVERPHSALQYRFKSIKNNTENTIEDDIMDLKVYVRNHEFLDLIKTMPGNGQVTIALDKSRCSVSFKHSGLHWGAAIQLKYKSPQSKSVTYDALSLQQIFASCTPQHNYSILTIMHSGVFKWSPSEPSELDESVVIYIAPSVQ